MTGAPSLRSLPRSDLSLALASVQHLWTRCQPACCSQTSAVYPEHVFPHEPRGLPRQVIQDHEKTPRRPFSPSRKTLKGSPGLPVDVGLPGVLNLLTHTATPCRHPDREHCQSQSGETRSPTVRCRQTAVGLQHPPDVR
ncbi:hypothetical protein DPEC_G00278430 [Dallia pectoralis]|uniref:Uncharacterized protein n=1 Tax=Dallia pectoralis TaxID=75939 RepID=A0ACC2FM90_DALPE|nr:hypothetical protein DPEC_G00278430 [Dallia pectoralis]